MADVEFLDHLLASYLDALATNEAMRNLAHETPYATYDLVTGHRYVKVTQMTPNGQTSVHAFVERATGLVFKPAGWAAPAKGARFDLTDDASRAACFARCEFTGGYLYR